MSTATDFPLQCAAGTLLSIKLETVSHWAFSGLQELNPIFPVLYLKPIMCLWIDVLLLACRWFQEYVDLPGLCLLLHRCNSSLNSDLFEDVNSPKWSPCRWEEGRVPTPYYLPEATSCFNRCHISRTFHSVALFQMAIWTSAAEDYAKAILGEILPKDAELFFSFFRDRCTRQYDPENHETFFLKDLDFLLNKM